MKQSIAFIIFFLSLSGYSQTSIKTEVSSYSTLDQYLWSFSMSKASPNKKALVDFKAMDNWRGLGRYLSVSDDGKYFAFTIDKPNPGFRFAGLFLNSVDSLVVQSTQHYWRQAFAGIKQGFFTADSKQFIYQDGTTLCFLQLAGRQVRKITDVASHKVSQNKWLAYQLRDEDGLILQNLSTGKEKLFPSATDFEFDASGRWLVCKSNTKELLLYGLATGTEKRFADAIDYAFSSGGKTIVVKTNASMQYIPLPQGDAKTVWTKKEKTGIGSYALDAIGKRLVFVIIDSIDATNNMIGYYESGMGKSVVKISNQTEDIPNGLTISHASFTDNGRYIKLSLQVKPNEVENSDETIAGVEVWNYKDAYLQSVQSKKLQETPVYNAILNIENNKLVFSESDGKKIVALQGDFAMVKKDYTAAFGDRFWRKGEDSCWLLDLSDGSSQLLSTKSDRFWFSPSGNYLVYFDVDKGCHYFSYNLRTRALSDISANVSAKRFIITGPNSLDGGESKFGNIAAWIENDGGLLVYDSYDIWKLDITGKKSAINLTNGFGQANNIILNLFATDHYSSKVPIANANETLLLRGFNTRNKENGFYKKAVNSAKVPELVYVGSYFMNQIGGCHAPNFSNSGMAPLKAKNTNSWIVQRQSASDAPNYYETKDFKKYRRLTNYQPQNGYQWFTQELLSFKHLTGEPGQGILYKPENFDPAKKYPVLIVFYEALSNNMYQFPVPTGNYCAISPGKSPLWFLNNGYLVFTPDIAVVPLKYGPKAYSVIEGAAQYLKTIPYVDGNKLGCASHSWSAQLGAYIFTHSKSISATAISEGFSYADMVNMALSPKNGRSNLQTVEVGRQSGNLWENKESWLDQTSVLNVDKAVGPLLLFCNKESTVDYQDQTFQFFTALRRLDKKVWWLKYDKGGHTLEDPKEIYDYTIRYTQFFDHYLQYAPAAQWMTQGIPFKLKGIESRYELDPQGICNSPNGKPCLVCQAWNQQHKKTPAMFQKEIKNWKLDKDIGAELERKINERKKVLDKVGEIQKREVMRMLNNK